MSERIERFEIAGTPRLAVRVPTGDTRVVPGEPGTVVIRLGGSDREIGRFVVERRGDTVIVEPERSGIAGRWTSVRLVIESGAPVELSLRSATGDLAARAPLAGLRAETATGEVDVPEVRGDAALKSASGDLRVGSVSGRLDVAAASGDVAVGFVGGELRVKTASGDIEIREASGDAAIKSASGDVAVGVFRGADLDVKTLSGDIEVGLAAGRRFDVSLQTVSGDVRTDYPISSEPGAASAARLTLTSVSGDVVVRPES